MKQISFVINTAVNELNHIKKTNYIKYEKSFLSESYIKDTMKIINNFYST